MSPVKRILMGGVLLGLAIQIALLLTGNSTGPVEVVTLILLGLFILFPN